MKFFCGLCGGAVIAVQRPGKHADALRPGHDVQGVLIVPGGSAYSCAESAQRLPDHRQAVQLSPWFHEKPPELEIALPIAGPVPDRIAGQLPDASGLSRLVHQGHSAGGDVKPFLPQKAIGFLKKTGMVCIVCV